MIICALYMYIRMGCRNDSEFNDEDKSFFGLLCIPIVTTTLNIIEYVILKIL